MVILEKLIRKIKNDQDYHWENSYNYSDLIIILWDRGWQLFRGIQKKLFFQKSNGLIFIGSRVKIKHFSKIRVGRNFIVGDFSYINGLSRKGIQIGNNVSIGRHSTLICTAVISQIGEGILIGSRTGINDGAYLAGQGGIKLGEDVIIGPGVKIFSENHLFDEHSIPIKKQGVRRAGVEIGDNCWIGANSVILSGVSIGVGCVVAAGAVVNKSVPKNSIVAGIPAKIIKKR